MKFDLAPKLERNNNRDDGQGRFGLEAMLAFFVQNHCFDIYVIVSLLFVISIYTSSHFRKFWSFHGRAC